MHQHNDYWAGKKQASLTEKQQNFFVRGQHDNGEARLDLVNRAFEIYYVAHSRIHKIIDHDHRHQMFSELRSAATAGCGMWGGVYDLEQAFEHLVANGGNWTDTNYHSYNGGTYSAFPKYVANCPTSCINFLKEIDKRILKLYNVVDDYKLKLEIFLLPEQDPLTITKALSAIIDGGDMAKPFLWLAPPSVESMVGKTLTFVEVLSTIDSGLTTYSKSIGTRGMGSGKGAAFAALQTILGLVPVLGGFYSCIIKMAPDLFNWFNGVDDLKHRVLDRASSGSDKYNIPSYR